MSFRAMQWAMDLRGIDMTAAERLVLFVLCHHHNGKTGQCNPAMKTIGDAAGITDRGARKAVRRLEDIGLVRSQKQSNGSGQTTNSYALFGDVDGESGRNHRSAPPRNGGSSPPPEPQYRPPPRNGGSAPPGTVVPPNI